MECPGCKADLRIKRSYKRVTGDTSPDTPTKVYDVLVFWCLNPNCEHFRKEIRETENLIYSPDQGLK